MAETNARGAGIGDDPRETARGGGPSRSQGSQNSRVGERRGQTGNDTGVPCKLGAVGEERDPQARTRSRADQIIASDDMMLIVRLIIAQGECLLKAAIGKDEELTMTTIRALAASLSEGKAHMRQLGQQHQWPESVKEEVIGRLDSIAREPMRQGANLVAAQVPQSWQDRCNDLKAKATSVIDQITYHITIRDWTLKDCQEYLVELEAKVNGAVMAMRLKYNNPNEGSLDMDVLLLIHNAREARDIALLLRQKHIEKLREAPALPPTAPRQE